MAISRAAIKTAFDTFALAVVATAAAKATLTGYGAIPTYPADATSDTSYNDVTAAIVTWQGNVDTASAAVVAAVADQRAKELLVIAIMPLDQWVEITPTVRATVTQLGVNSKPLPASRQLTWVEHVTFTSSFPVQS